MLKTQSLYCHYSHSVVFSISFHSRELFMFNNFAKHTFQSMFFDVVPLVLLILGVFHSSLKSACRDDSHEKIALKIYTNTDTKIDAVRIVCFIEMKDVEEIYKRFYRRICSTASRLNCERAKGRRERREKC